MEIEKISYRKMLKLQLPNLARRVINIAEKHDPEVLKIKGAYDLLVAQKPNILLLTEPYGAHPVTQELTPYRQKCYMYAQKIMYNMNMVVREHAGNLTSEVLDTEKTVKRYLHRLDLCKSEELVLERLNDFFKTIEQNEALETALDGFGLTDDLDNLQSAHSTLEELLDKRTRLTSERPQQKTGELSKLVIKALKDLYMQIELAVVLNPELDYAPLINELNIAIREVKNKVNARLLYNKRKAEGLETDEDGSDNESTNPEVTSTMMMNSQHVGTTEGNGFEERFEKQLDQKKTVATSSGKQLQLPSMNGEA